MYDHVEIIKNIGADRCIPYTFDIHPGEQAFLKCVLYYRFRFAAYQNHHHHFESWADY